MPNGDMEAGRGAQPARASGPVWERRKPDTVKANNGWRYWTHGEGAGLVGALIVLVMLLNPWEPTFDDGELLGAYWFVGCLLICWYVNAQQGGLVSATDRSNFANDRLPIVAMLLSSLPVIVSGVMVVLAGFVWALFFLEQRPPGVFGLSLGKAAIVVIVVYVCWGDLVHNATMVIRAMRLRQETAIEGTKN